MESKKKPALETAPESEGRKDGREAAIELIKGLHKRGAQAREEVLKKALADKKRNAKLKDSCGSDFACSKSCKKLKERKCPLLIFIRDRFHYGCFISEKEVIPLSKELEKDYDDLAEQIRGSNPPGGCGSQELPRQIITRLIEDPEKLKLIIKAKSFEEGNKKEKRHHKAADRFEAEIIKTERELYQILERDPKWIEVLRGLGRKVKDSWAYVQNIGLKKAPTRAELNTLGVCDASEESLWNLLKAPHAIDPKSMVDDVDFEAEKIYFNIKVKRDPITFKRFMNIFSTLRTSGQLQR